MYSLDGSNANDLRDLLCQSYYALTTQTTALRLIKKCLDGETAEWEEEMIIDLLYLQPDPNKLLELIGKIYTNKPAANSDEDYKNGLNKLEWQLDGGEQELLKRRFGTSNF